MSIVFENIFFSGDKMPSFPDRVKEYRESSNMTQQEMANFLGVTVQHYQRLEWGKSKPTLKILEILADDYETTIDYMLGRCNVRWSADELQRQIDHLHGQMGIPLKTII